MLLVEAYDYWTRSEPRRESTARRYRGAIRRLVGLGLIRVEDVTRERVIQIQRDLLGRGLEPVSVRTELACLRGVVAQLEAHGLFSTGTLAEVRKVAIRPAKRGVRHRVRHCNRAEFDLLASAAARVEPRLELPIRVAALAGPRIGELARMRAEDRLGSWLTIETLPEFGEAGSCKTGPRGISVCAELAQLFRERLPKIGWLFPSGAKGRRRRTPFISRWTLEQGIKRIRREAGLEDDLTFMVLRHTRASWWLQGGASIYKVADWLGHSTETCEESYGSLVDGYDPDCERMPA